MATSSSWSTNSSSSLFTTTSVDWGTSSVSVTLPSGYYGAPYVGTYSPGLSVSGSGTSWTVSLGSLGVGTYFVRWISDYQVSPNTTNYYYSGIFITIAAVAPSPVYIATSDSYPDFGQTFTITATCSGAARMSLWRSLDGGSSFTKIVQDDASNGTLTRNETASATYPDLAYYSYGANDNWTSSSQSSTIYVTAVPAAPTALTFTNDGDASATEQVTVTGSGGSGGDIEVSNDNSNWYANGTKFDHARNSSITYYARRRLSGSSTSISSSYNDSHFVDYLSPNTNATCSNVNISATATSATISIIGGVATQEAYRVCASNAYTTNTQVVGNSLAAWTPYANDTQSISSSLPAEGNTNTYYVYAYRYTTYGGAGQYYLAGSFTIARAVAIIAPTVDDTMSNHTVATTASQTTTVDISLSALGSNGTLEYNVSTTTTLPTTGWTTGDPSVTRGTGYYLWARRSSSEYDRSETKLTIPYISEDSDIDDIADQAITNATTQFTVTIANGNANDVYQVRNSDGTEEHESRTGNGSITVTDAPADNSQKSYTIYAKRPTDAGGNDTFIDTETNFTITAYAVSSGGSTYTVNFNSNQTKNVFSDDSIDVNYDIQSGDTNGSWSWVSYSGTTPYPTAGYIWSGSATGYTYISTLDNFTGSSYSAQLISPTRSTGITLSGTITDPYGVTDVTIAGSDDQESGTTNVESASVTFDTYREGETLDFSVTNGTLEKNDSGTWTSSGTIDDGDTYRLRGDASATYGGTTTVSVVFSKNSSDKRTETFVINTEDLTAPTDLTFANDGDVSATEQVTVTASGGTGGTLKVSNDGSTWYANGTKFDHTRGSSVTYYARREGLYSQNSSSYSESHSVGYLAPLAFSYTVSDADPLAYGDTGFNVTIADADTDHTYRVLYDGTNAGTITSNGNIAITGSELPSAGGQRTYTVQVARGTTTGGDGLYDTIGTFTRAMRPSNPTISASTASTASSSVTVTVTGASTGATEYRFSKDSGSTYTAWQSSSSYAFGSLTRGTAYGFRIQARSSYAEAASTASLSYPVPYLNPDLDVTVTGSPFSVGYNITSLNIAITDVSTVEKVRVISSNVSGGPWTASAFGNATISVATPANDSTGNYTVEIILKQTSGGDETDWQTSDTTFTITRAANSAPSIDSFSASPSNTTGAQTVTLSAACSDSDGTVDSISITQVSGTTVTLSTQSESGIGTSSATASRTFTSPDADGTLVFQVSATDDYAGATGTAQITVVTNETGTVVNPPSGDGYGLEVYGASGEVYLSVTDRVMSLGETGNITIPANTLSATGDFNKNGGTVIAVIQTNNFTGYFSYLTAANITWAAHPTDSTKVRVTATRASQDTDFGYGVEMSIDVLVVVD